MTLPAVAGRINNYQVMCKNSAKSAGFTLLELMMTIAIAGILVTMAIPSFNLTISSNRLTNYANDLVGALNLARSEAVKRGMQVTILSNSGTASDWDAGWTVFTDSNVIGVIDGSDTVLRTYPQLTSGYTLRTGGNYTLWIAYFPTGLITSSTGRNNDTFRLCNATDSRAITINLVGRALVLTVAASCP